MGKVKGHRPADLWAWPGAFILTKAPGAPPGGEAGGGSRPAPASGMGRTLGQKESLRRSGLEEGEHLEKRQGDGRSEVPGTHTPARQW